MRRLHAVRLARRPATLLGALLLAGACRSGAPSAGGPAQPAAPRPPTSAGELVARMHDRWAGKWYRGLTYTQQNTFTTPRGEQTSEWAVAQQVPGRQSVDFLPVSQKSGVLSVDHTQRIFTNGRVTDERALVNAFILLGADVYAQPAARTMRLLDSLPVDTTKFYGTRGVRQMYVVGAVPGDTASNQFWVDADSLLLRRFVQKSTRAGRTTVSESRITYQDVGGFPVPGEIVSTRNGQPYQRQVLTRVKVNPTLPAELFDPERWSTVARP